MNRMQILPFICMLPLMVAALLGCKPASQQKQPEASKSPDSVMADSVKILYVGTYTEKNSPVAGKSNGIYIYELNMNTGRLRLLGNSPLTMNPSYLAIDAGKERLFAVNEMGDDKKPAGTISAFHLTSQGKEMEFINSVPSEGNYPCYVSIDRSGKWVMCANYGSGTVAVLPVLNDGSLGKASCIDQHKGKSHSPRQESPHAHMIISHPSGGQFVYSCDLGTDIIYIYKLDASQGKLIPSGYRYVTQSGAGPRHLAFHPVKNFAYEVNELNGTIEVMHVDTLTGALARLQIVPTVENAKGEEASCADIHLTSSGRYLYSSNRGEINNLAMFEVDQETGKLTLIGYQPVKGKTPRNFVIDPTGKFLLVANQDSDNVVTFRIDQSTGKLIDIGVETIVPSPVCLKFLK
jgi:6-phosphogluconolactonase